MIHPLFIGTTELLLVGGLALLLFGGKKLPEMMKGLGQGVQSFKQGMNEPLPVDDKKEEPAAEESKATEATAEMQPTEAADKK